MSESRAWWACTAGCVLLAIALCVNASSDPDLGFHVATGRAVLASGAIPTTNVLSYAEPAHAWVNQQWLPATIFALAFDRAGFAGTLAIRVALIALTTLVLVLTGARLGASRGWTVVFVTLGAWAAAFRFVERPLLFSNLALAIVLFACASARADRAHATRWIVLATAAASLAVHLHAGALFSLLALAVLAAACVLEPAAAKRAGRVALARPVDGAVLVAATLIAIAVAAATLALYHPNGLEVLAFPLRMASDAYLQEHLVEFRPPYAQPLRVLAPYWGFVGAAGVVLAASWRRPLPLLAIASFGIAISLRHARFADLAWIAGAPALAALATQRWPSVPLRPLAVSLALGAFADRASIAAPGIGGAPPIWPEALFDAIEAEHLAGPMFVQDGWAGPFLARFWPRERVFFHPAFEAYSAEHYALYQRVRYGEPGWDEALDRFGVQVVVMRYTSERERALQSGRPNLRQRLAASDAWALFAADDVGEIFVRRAGANADRAAGLPSGVDPDRLALDRAPRSTRAGLEALARARPSDRVRVLLAIARADDGDTAGAAAAIAGVHDASLAALGRRALSRVHE